MKLLQIYLAVLQTVDRKYLLEKQECVELDRLTRHKYGSMWFMVDFVCFVAALRYGKCLMHDDELNGSKVCMQVFLLRFYNSNWAWLCKPKANWT